MANNPKIVILFNQISKHPTLDETDVLKEVDLVGETLKKLGYQVYKVAFSLKLKKVIKQLSKIRPGLVFNLVESINNKGELIYLAPAILNFLHLHYTGAHLEATFMTSHKVLAKKTLQRLGIPTPTWFKVSDLADLNPHEQYIVKPIWESGSVGIEADAIFQGHDLTFLTHKVQQSPAVFVEQFIAGREFNLSMLRGKLLPPAEIKFLNYPVDKPKIVGYHAKWNPDTFEYAHTSRCFEFGEHDQPLLEKLQQICLTCWQEFDLRGYARVDFRVDAQGLPYVLEINVNPGIAPDSGFVAATQRAGLAFTEVVEQIIQDAFLSYHKPLPVGEASCSHSPFRL
jgi:D-alanine-D-alanine ligase